jgi:hypothetical protein
MTAPIEQGTGPGANSSPAPRHGDTFELLSWGGWSLGPGPQHSQGSQPAAVLPSSTRLGLGSQEEGDSETGPQPTQGGLAKAVRAASAHDTRR